jgi:hypothetical protein
VRDSIRERSRTWTAYWDLPVDPESGKHRQGSEGGARELTSTLEAPSRAVHARLVAAGDRRHAIRPAPHERDAMPPAIPDAGRAVIDPTPPALSLRFP